MLKRIFYMKKFTTVALTTLFASALLSTSVMASDWLKSASESVAGSVKDSVKESTKAATDSAYNSMVTTALGLVEGKTKAAYVQEKLGEPVSKKTTEGAEIWTYSLNALEAKYPGLTPALQQFPQTQQQIELSVTDAVVKKINIIKA
jgi:hypothetical protein